MTTRTAKQLAAIYEALTETKIGIINNCLPRPHVGLCDNIQEALALRTVDRESSIITGMGYTLELMRNWPKSTGRKHYPVPVTLVGMADEREEYIHRKYNRTMYKGKAGRLRMQLLNFMIRQTWKDLQDAKAREAAQ